MHDRRLCAGYGYCDGSDLIRWDVRVLDSATMIDGWFDGFKIGVRSRQDYGYTRAHGVCGDTLIWMVWLDGMEDGLVDC